MELFQLNRKVDTSGVSGTGIVAQGVKFDNGKVAVTFISGPVSSVIVYDSFGDALKVHGHGSHTIPEEVAATNQESALAMAKVHAYDHSKKLICEYCNQGLTAFKPQGSPTWKHEVDDTIGDFGGVPFLADCKASAICDARSELY
jgi:hypothetical protein